MEELDKKIIAVLSNLTKLTTLKRMEWELKSPPTAMTRGSDDVIPIFFEGVYNNRRIGVFERRYRGFDPDSETSYWTDDLGIAFLDVADNVLWQYNGYSPALRNLIDAVRRSVADIDGILDDLSLEDD